MPIAAAQTVQGLAIQLEFIKHIWLEITIITWGTVFLKDLIKYLKIYRYIQYIFFPQPNTFNMEILQQRSI